MHSPTVVRRSVEQDDRHAGLSPYGERSVLARGRPFSRAAAQAH